jgi:hypothetical protein
MIKIHGYAFTSSNAEATPGVTSAYNLRDVCCIHDVSFCAHCELWMYVKDNRMCGR